MSKPDTLRSIDDLGNHVRSTLRRADNPVPHSLRALLPRLIRHALRLRLVDQDEVYPGMRKMMQWAELRSERQTRRLVGVLRDAGVLRATAYLAGGQARATRYVFDPVALFRWLVRLGCNPSKQLRAKLERWNIGAAIRSVGRAITRTFTRTSCPPESCNRPESTRSGHDRRSAEKVAAAAPSGFSANRLLSNARCGPPLGGLRSKLLENLGLSADLVPMPGSAKAGGGRGGSFAFPLTGGGS